jgi:hypothetical protein
MTICGILLRRCGLDEGLLSMMFGGHNPEKTIALSDAKKAGVGLIDRLGIAGVYDRASLKDSTDANRLAKEIIANSQLRKEQSQLNKEVNQYNREQKRLPREVELELDPLDQIEFAQLGRQKVKPTPRPKISWDDAVKIGRELRKSERNPQ